MDTTSQDEQDRKRKVNEVHPYHEINDNVQIQVDSIETQVDNDPSQAKGDEEPLENLESGCTTSKKLNCIVALLTTLIVLCTGAVVVRFTQEEAIPTDPVVYYFQGDSSS